VVSGVKAVKLVGCRKLDVVWMEKSVGSGVVDGQSGPYTKWEEKKRKKSEIGKTFGRSLTRVVRRRSGGLDFLGYNAQIRKVCTTRGLALQMNPNNNRNNWEQAPELNSQ
jgi:hypothetical protein